MNSSWQNIKLGDAATFVNGYAFKPTQWSKKGLEIIRIQNLTKHGSDINYYDGEIDEKYKVKNGDLLISWSATLGIYEWEGADAWLNQHIFKVVFNKKKFDKVFFKYLIFAALKRMEKEVHGSTMKHITKKRFDNLSIVYPPLPTQKKIAEILDTADALRKKTQQLIEHYDQLAQSIFLDMFGDPVSNPQKLPTVKLGDLGIWQSGGTPSREKKEYFEGTIPWLSSGELEHMYISQSRENINEKAIVETSAKMVPKGSLLLGMYDTAALKSTISEVPLSCNQAIAFSRLNDKITNTIYVYFIIQIGREHYRRLQRGVRQKNLNLSMVRDIEILFPTLTLQNQFAEKIELIEKQKELAKQSLKESEDLFQALMQKAFKGELIK